MQHLHNNRIVEQYINDTNILNIYRTGSIVYKSNNINSDEDFIFIVKDKMISNNDNIKIFTLSEFNNGIFLCNISVLECLFLNKEFILKETITFDNILINKENLRISISTIVSNSWVRGKKKILEENDINLGLKSIFHSLRILDFGIQLAENNKIINYESSNYILIDLYKFHNLYTNNIDLYKIINSKYKQLLNNKLSIFRKLCPHNNNILNKKIEISNILKAYGIINDELTNNILTILI